MVRHLLLFVIGIAVLLAGIPALRYNFQLGLVVMVAGFVLAAHAQVRVLVAVTRWAQAMGKQGRGARGRNRIDVRR